MAHQQARVIQVIEVTYVKGEGTHDAPMHLAADYFSPDGRFLATTNEPSEDTANRHFERSDRTEPEQ